ncbi:MAG: hypothetical protein WDO74_17865 [Pseudomonadota bacterium]
MKLHPAMHLDDPTFDSFIDGTAAAPNGPDVDVSDTVPPSRPFAEAEPVKSILSDPPDALEPSSGTEGAVLEELLLLEDDHSDEIERELELKRLAAKEIEELVELYS